MHYKAPCTTYIVFIDESKKGIKTEFASNEQPLSMKWNGDQSILPYDIYKDNKEGIFKFNSAPGLKSLEFWAYGDDIEIEVNGEKSKLLFKEEAIDNLRKYNYEISNPTPISQEICITINNQKKGFSDVSAFPFPIRQICDIGNISLGDWTLIDGLRSYSGGAWYRKTINIDSDMISKDMVLDLGNVVSTARLFVNGKEVGLKMTPPWQFNIKDYINEGENLFEIKVFNTAGNHYISIPTNYRGNPKAGIIGPAKIIYK